jgi:hypothetical protein
MPSRMAQFFSILLFGAALGVGVRWSIAEPGALPCAITGLVAACFAMFLADYARYDE